MKQDKAILKCSYIWTRIQKQLFFTTGKKGLFNAPIDIKKTIVYINIVMM